jgi:ADP-ribose pyrophosphatase YjhB (NUDIX family)
VPSDIDVRLDGHRFNFCVRAIVRRRGSVLACSLPGTSWFWLPGGRVRTGETTRDALERELLEELGLQVTPGPLAMVIENFFPHEGGRFHEIGLYFLVELPEEAEPTSAIDAENGAIFRWLALDELPTMDLRPAFLRDALRRELSGPEHFVHVE